MTRSCWLLSALVLSSSAFAGDDLDDILGRDDEEEDGPAPAPTGPADDLGPRDAETLAKCIKPAEIGQLVADVCALPQHLCIQETILWPMVQEVSPL